MKKLIDYFIDRSLLVNLLTVIILLAGGLSLYSLQKETFPQVEFDVITVVTSYPGSSAEDVEKLVTLSIERELKVVNGIKKMNAMSMEGSSVFYLEVDPDEDLDDVLDDVKNAVDTVDDLPNDAEIPRVKSIDNKTRGTIKVGLTHPDYKKLRVASKTLRDKLESISGVSRVDLAGYQKDEILVEVNPVKLNNYELTISEVTQSIRNSNINLSAGKIETPNGDIIVRTNSEFSKISDIESIPVRSNNTGRKVTISDVATVKRAPQDSTVLERSNGVRAIFLDVKIKEKADVIRTTEKIKKATTKFLKVDLDMATSGFGYNFVDDMSYYVKRRLGILTQSGLQGIILVFLCLLCFLNFGTSVVTSLGAPIAFMIAFVAMDYMGISINLISMFALIMVLGMLVDDSIIVAEHFYHHVENGKSPREAARMAAISTVKPVLATILTTIIAFSSLFFMGGIMGKFLWPIPVVIIICLCGSLFECFFILPSHLSDFVPYKKKDKKERWYDRIIRGYGKVLRPCLKHPFVFSFLFIVLFLGTLFVAKGMKFELFPGDDVRVVFLQLKGKVGTPLEKSNMAMKSIEEMVMKEVKPEELDQIRAKVGTLRSDHSMKIGTHYASLILYLTPPDERERDTDEIVDLITKKAKILAPDFIVTNKKMQGGPPKGKPVEIELMGENIEELKVVSKKVLTLLKGTPGVSSSEIDFEEGKKQILIDINQGEAKRLGLSIRDIAFELRRALAGDPITEIRESDEDIEVKVLLDKKSRSNVEVLNNLFIPNMAGQRIPLKRIAKLIYKPGAFVIRRKNRKRIFSVGGTLNKAVTNPVKIAKTLRPKLEEILKNHNGVEYNFGGENEDTKESMAGLRKAGIISFALIFFVLVIMFSSLGQPLVIMSAIPMGLIGVVIAFKIMGIALGFMAMLGVVALIGVVVNDSIVLVTFINERRNKITDDVEAIWGASKDRFRPVILTTFTTVVGLLPIAHAGFFGGSTGDPFVKPMAFSFAYGLLFASIITLFFIPCNYLIYLRFNNFASGIINKLKGFIQRPVSETASRNEV